MLKKIIELYQIDAQPVSSKQLLTETKLALSSATIRYEMQWLEESGYLEKTHTSSGRVPAQRGYDYYIEHLVTLDEDNEYFPMIEKIIKENNEKCENAIKEAVKLISEVTTYPILTAQDSLENNYISKVDFVITGFNSAIILVITSENKILNNTIVFDDEYDTTQVAKVIQTLNEVLVNKSLADAKKILEDKKVIKDIFDLMKYQENIISSFIEAFNNFSGDNLFATGVSNSLMHSQLNNPNAIRKLFDVLENKNLIKLLPQGEDKIGLEHNQLKITPYNDYTLITMPYGTNSGHKGTIAVVGPNRMDYPKIISLLQYLSKMIKDI